MAEERSPEESSTSTAFIRVHGVLSELGRVHDLDGVLNTIAQASLTLLGASAVSIGRLEAEQGLLRALRNAGDLAAWEEPVPIDEIYTAETYSTLLRQVDRPHPWTACVLDPETDPGEAALLGRQGKCCALAIPIVLRRQVWGELYATRTTHLPFSSVEMALGQLLGASLALGIDRVTGHEELRRMAYLDPLTGLANRRRADETMETALDEGREVLVALFDVDGMKTVNDRDGHAAGDRMLVRVGISLSAAASAVPGTIAARLGGDEFALVSIDGDRSKFAIEVARVVTGARDLAIGAGLSAGVSDSHAVVLKRPDPKSIYRRADAALYRAKRAGGSQVVHAKTHLNPYDPASPEAEEVRRHPVVSRGGVTRMVLGDQVERSRLDQLIAVAQEVTTALDASSWWVSMAPSGSDQLVTMACGIDRVPTADASTASMSTVGSVYRMHDFPETQRIIDARMAQIIRLHDPEIDQSEADFLAELGYTANLMAGAQDSSGRSWLVEVFTDLLSVDPDQAKSHLLGAVLAVFPAQSADDLVTD